MAWLVLILGGLFQIIWIYELILSDGFTRLGPSLLSLLVAIASVELLIWSIRNLPLVSSYAVWIVTATFGVGLIGRVILAGIASPTQITIGPIAAILLLLVSGLPGLK